MNIKHVVIGLVLITVVSFFIGGAYIAKDLNNMRNINDKAIDEYLESEVNFDIIDVDLRADTISIVSTNGSKIKARLSGNVKSSYENSELNLVLEEVGNRLKIRKNIKNYDENFILFDFSTQYYEELDFVLEVPTNKLFDLDVASYSAEQMISNIDFNDVSLEQYSGSILFENSNIKDFECSSSSGEVILKFMEVREIDCSAYSGDTVLVEVNSESVQLETSSGEIEIKDSDIGNLKSATYSGDVELENVDFNDLRIKTSSGDVIIDSKSIGDLEVETYSGDVELNIPKNSEFLLEYESYSGDLENDFPITIKENTRNSIIGVVGEGEHDFDIKTSSGNLLISN